MVKCDECGKDVASYYEKENRNLCLSCYTDIVEKDKSISTHENFFQYLKLQIRIFEVLGIIFAFLCLIGSFLPWTSISTVFGTLSYGAMGKDGTIILISSLIAFGLFYYGIYTTKRDIPSLGIVIIGIINLSIVIIDGLNLSRLFSEIETAYAYPEIGSGIYIIGIGSVGLIISGIGNYTYKPNRYRMVKQESKTYSHDNYSRKRYCPGCGRAIPFDALICPYCGKKFE